MVFCSAQYVPAVLFPGRFQCPCDRVSLPSQKIHLRTGNLSLVGGTSVPQRTSKIFQWKPRSITAMLTLAVGAPSVGVPVVTSAYNCHDPTVSAIVAPHLYMLLFSKGTHIAGSRSQHELSHERTFRSLAKQKAIESRLRIPLWKPRSLTPQ